jgi:hypothetical protein
MVALSERVEAIRNSVDVFNPDARQSARSLFEAQEKLWKLLPEITTLSSERDLLVETLKRVIDTSNRIDLGGKARAATMEAIARKALTGVTGG